jgi:hypothetical protein
MNPFHAQMRDWRTALMDWQGQMPHGGGFAGGPGAFIDARHMWMGQMPVRPQHPQILNALTQRANA